MRISLRVSTIGIVALALLGVGIFIYASGEEVTLRFFPWFIGGSVVIILLLAAMLLWGVLRPLHRIRRATHRFSSRTSENVDIHAPLFAELAWLVEDINTMGRKMQKERDEIEEERQTLEVRIRARTRELQELTNTLEDKVKERTQTLQEKVDELERFRQLAVGRELKMKELKEKIHALEAECGKGDASPAAPSDDAEDDGNVPEAR